MENYEPGFGRKKREKETAIIKTRKQTKQVRKLAYEN